MPTSEGKCCADVRAALASLETRLTEFDKRYEQRFTAQEKALEKAEMAQEAKNQTLNELRGIVSDQQGAFARTAVVDLQIRVLTERIDVIALEQRENKGRGTGLHVAWAYLVGAGTLIATIATIISVILFKRS